MAPQGRGWVGISPKPVPMVPFEGESQRGRLWERLWGAATGRHAVTRDKVSAGLDLPCARVSFLLLSPGLVVFSIVRSIPLPGACPMRPPVAANHP